MPLINWGPSEQPRPPELRWLPKDEVVAAPAPSGRARLGLGNFGDPKGSVPAGLRRHGPQPAAEAIAEQEPEQAAEEGEAQEEQQGAGLEARQQLPGEAALGASQARVELSSHQGR